MLKPKIFYPGCHCELSLQLFGDVLFSDGAEAIGFLQKFTQD
jgi:hypothetical protein